MARVKIDETILEDAVLTMSGGRLCLRWAADAWDGTLDSAAELLGVASELREVDADNMTVALYAVRGLASLRMDAEHAAMEAVLCVDPMEVGAAEKLGQQIEQQGRELGAAIEAQGRTFGAAIEAQSTALGERIDGQATLLGAARVAAHRGWADADSIGRKPSRGMGGRIGECDFRCFPNSDTPSSFSIKRRCGVYLWWWCRIKLSTQYQTIRCFESCGQPVPSADDRCWQQSATQQHAAVAGRGPLEARDISYAARKGAAV